MRYLKFTISHYRAIEEKIIIDISKNSLIPLVGINECGKTTILQAIYCFDHFNDKEYGSKHLKDIKNLYRTSEKEDTTIAAEIEARYSELLKIFQDYLNDLKGDNTEDDNKNTHYSFPISKNDYRGFITIKRNLTTGKYQLDEILNFSYLDESFAQGLCEKIILHLPYILYNDDFMDRPPTALPIPDQKPDNLTGWLAIYEELFSTASENFSLFSLIKETDQRRIRSILSDVKGTINNTLSKAWKTFLLSNHGSLEVDLNLLPFTDPEKKCKNQLEIKINEKIGSKERSFDIVDRSKGFLWFFNFVMKLEFNSKIAGAKKDTIYLLDEPGSYLHYSAQEKLCKKLVEISQKHGNVIYCTHSHTLLNPDLIPLNNIYIVEKDNQKRIKATPLPRVKTKFEDSNAYQPILEALQISALNFIKSNNPVIAVEGIYDKYTIDLFIDLALKVSILPGTSANSIIKNIQFLNAFNCKYIALWDNDKEGRDNYDKACKFFGEHESAKFDKLPLKGLENRKMEKMFENNDLKLIALELGLTEDSQYEKIISTLHFSKVEVQKKIRNKLSEGTKENFLILKSILEKRLTSSSEDS